MPKRDIERFLSLAQSMREEEATEAGQLTFMGQVLVQMTLPHEDPGDVEFYERSNGDMSLVIQRGVVKDDDGRTIASGIPYGVYPRLILSWITREAVRTKSRELRLGNSLTQFMRELGLDATGGERGTITILREQMRRLFTSRIAVVRGGAGSFEQAGMQISRRMRLWWDPRDIHSMDLFGSVVELSDDFYHLLIERPVPIDMRALKALKSSPLGLDLYMWLTYRVSYMKSETVISWKQLEKQIGADYSRTKDFTQAVKRELKRIRLVWPDLKYETPRGRLVLKPSPTHVPKLHKAL